MAQIIDFIRRPDYVFDSEVAAVLVAAAYDRAIFDLHDKNHSVAVREISIIKLAAAGERNPDKLCQPR